MELGLQMTAESKLHGLFPGEDCCSGLIRHEIMKEGRICSTGLIRLGVIAGYED